jgi:multicomponent Na+:H+ antiporter subunit G
MIREILIGLLLLSGSFLMFLAGLGLLRFSDALCRAHALAKASTCGICLLLLALWVTLNDEISGLKIFLVITFSLLTIPLASHLTALLIYRHGHQSSSLPQPRKTKGSEPPHEGK